MRRLGGGLVVVGVLALFLVGPAAHGAAAAPLGTVFTVNTTDNTEDDVCDASHCSLLDAWYASEHNAGHDTIAFDIPGPPPHVIHPPSTLLFSQPVDILGDTQPGWSAGHPTVVIDDTGNLGYGLELDGGNSTVRGLVIHGSYGSAIVLERFKPVVGGNVVEGNFIGTNATGTAAVATATVGAAVEVHGFASCCDGAPNNRIGGTTPEQRNVIVAGLGVELLSSGNLVEGNYIGTDADGSVALDAAASDWGVYLVGDDNVVGGTAGVTAGGGCTGACNLISGGGGVYLSGSDNTVQANLIGTDVTGTKALRLGGPDIAVYIEANSETGPVCGQSHQAVRNLVGGTEPGAGNVIAGASAYGVEINATSPYPSLPTCDPTDNRVEGNLIGTDVSGTRATDAAGRSFGNRLLGVSDVNTVQDVIGGADPAARNVISNNGRGVAVGNSSGVVVQGNLVGTDVTGTQDLGNGGDGITGGDNALATLIADNVVSGNGRYGIDDSGGPSWRIVGNRIGTNAAGTGALGNDQGGIDSIFGGAGVIGGPTDAERNLISGNGGDGIDAAFEEVRIVNNYIGTDVTGTLKLPNHDNGVQLDSDVMLYSGAPQLGEPGAGNLIAGNGLDGVRVTGGVPTSTIEANEIGTTADGSAPLGNGRNGVTLANPGTVGGSGAGEGNLISGNGANGIAKACGAGAVIAGNRIGTNAAGTAAVPNHASGITSSCGAMTVGGTAGTTAGGPCTGACNLVSGNAGDGIDTNGSSVSMTVQGNFVGTDVGGRYPLPNDGDGVVLGGESTLGGTDAAARNVIAGNGGDGVVLNSGQNIVQGNLIGTDASGEAVLGNAGSGILDNGVQDTIGGTAAGAGNVISGNSGSGIELRNHPDVVQGNRIGTDLAGTADLGNRGHGVLVVAAGSPGMIGGTAAGAGNVIWFNGGDGVAVTGRTVGVAILGNSIFADAGLGIDLDDDGVTPNDSPCIVFTKCANLHQNFPVVTSAADSTITGTLHSQPNSVYRVELFSNTGVAPCDASGNGEGETFLAATDVTTDGSGNASFAVTLPSPLPAGAAVTATATSQQNNTSEFSQCVATAGKIVVEKQTNPSGSSQSFAFTSSYGSGFSLIDGESNTSDPLAPGTYSVSETPVSGWDASANCDDGSPIDKIDLGPGETVTCTFTNTQRATLVVKKETIPTGTSADFPFTAPGLSPSSFTLAAGGSQTFSDLLPGAGYSVAESVPPGWDLSAASCDDGSPPSNIDLSPGELVTCTFTDTAVFPGTGFFVIGDGNAAIGTQVTFWGAQWWKLNSLTGGKAPASFKGYAKSAGGPMCGITWTTDPGNSPPPPPGPLPPYIAVIVASSISNSGALISGNAVNIVIVQTDPGYAPDPGHEGTGTVVSTLC